MGSKPEELETIVHQENCNNMVTVTQVGWGDFHHWSAARDGCKHLRRDRQGRRGGGVALYIRECSVCMELRNSDDEVECPWVRKGGRLTRQTSWLGVSYSPPNQDEEADDRFCERLADMS